MKQLWAPWRLEYVTGDREDGCLFCRLLSGDDDKKNLVLKRSSHTAVVMNRYPYANGHLMICPIRHTSEAGDLSGSEKAGMMDALSQAIAVLRETMKPEGFNAGFNIGSAAGAGVADHLHMHVVPRWNGDVNFMPVLGDTGVISQHLDDLWESLHRKFNA